MEAECLFDEVAKSVGFGLGGDDELSFDLFVGNGHGFLHSLLYLIIKTNLKD